MAGISLRLIASLAPSEIALEYSNLTESHPIYQFHLHLILQLTPGIARQLATAQNTGASALQAQDEDIDMPTPPDSPTLRPINLGQQASQIIVNQGPANAPNPLPVHQNLAQPVQQENVGPAQNLRTMRNEASFPFYVDYHCPHTSYFASETLEFTRITLRYCQIDDNAGPTESVEEKDEGYWTGDVAHQRMLEADMAEERRGHAISYHSPTK
ncbi:hypothetical protein B0H14DRAFT_2652568 [Mycena olivaceomarginata]|nr:hypothetical protein B0H14DRAFT_2652568 [Mycena olivaceomarginata]